MALLTWASPIRCGVLLGALLPALAIAESAQGQNVGEYQLKAAFLYNFAKFVEWPSAAYKSPADPTVICVLGQNPFGHSLQEAIAGKVIAGRSLAIQEVSDVKQANSCQILFVSSSERKRWKSILNGIKLCGVLTVGESDEFAESGGIIGLDLQDGKVRFRINLGVAEQEQLRISSKLLSLAQVVKK